jgi:hypothetical protein
VAWHNQSSITSKQFRCGYCSSHIASAAGFFSGGGSRQIYICTHCDQPTYFNDKGNPLPGIPFGNAVAHLPADVAALYDEARRCSAAGAYTAAVLLARKLLMNLAVGLEAKPGQPFIVYVEYLATKGYVPPNGKTWVDHIRKKGNEATHEIVLMGQSDAEDLIAFSEMLLKFIYEFPNKVPKPAS